MVPFVKIISEKYNLKKTQKNEKNIFTLYSPKKAIIEKADTLSIDTELLIKLPENSSAFVATKFEGQEILKIICPTSTKKRLWITKRILFEQISDHQGRRYQISYNRARQYQNTMRRQKRNH